MLSPAKVNLGLKILYKRTDGYHELRSVFLRLDFGDEIEIESIPEKTLELNSKILLTGKALDDYLMVSEKGDLEKNILFKTWKKASEKKEFHGVKIRLLKRIPSGGGLGGGSSNSASLLKFLFPEETKNPSPDFLEFASKIGADVPFFLKDSHQMVSGIGEKLENIEIHPGFGILVIPGLVIPTGPAFTSLKKPLQEDPRSESWKYLGERELSCLKKGDWSILSGLLENDFEPFAVSMYPELAGLKMEFRNLGIPFVSMSGTGSCFYGITGDSLQRDKALQILKDRFPHYQIVSFNF